MASESSNTERRRPSGIDVLKSSIRLSNRSTLLTEELSSTKEANVRLRHNLDSIRNSFDEKVLENQKHIAEICDLRSELKMARTKIQTYKEADQNTLRDHYEEEIASLTKQLYTANETIQAFKKAGRRSHEPDQQQEEAQAFSIKQISLQDSLPLDIKLRAELKNHVIEARKVRRGLSKEVTSVSKAREFTNGKVRKLVDADIEETYKAFQEKLSSVELKLEKFETSYEHLLNKEMTSELQAELKQLYSLNEGLEATIKVLLKEADKRNIHYGKISRPKIDVSHIKRRFSGSIINQSIHVYELFHLVDDELKESQITYDRSGALIKALCGGLALKCIEDAFKLQTYPDPNDIRSLLKRRFGNKGKILLQIQEEHEKVGCIPSIGEIAGIYYTRYSKSQAHCELIEKAKMVRAPCSDPNETEMDQYTEILAGLLDSVAQYIFFKENKNNTQEAKFESICKTIHSIRDDSSKELIKTGTSDNITDFNEDLEDEEPDKEQSENEEYDDDVYC